VGGGDEKEYLLGKENIDLPLGENVIRFLFTKKREHELNIRGSWEQSNILAAERSFEYIEPDKQTTTKLRRKQDGTTQISN
jgi:hypothetical protein